MSTRNLQLSLCLAALPAPLVLAQSSSFEWLRLPDGWQYTVPTAVSADGSTVVGFASIPSISSSRAFRWTRSTGFELIEPLPGSEGYISYAWDVSADGSVVVGIDVSAEQGGAFRWTEAQGIEPLGTLGWIGNNSIATSVSADGQVVFGYVVRDGRGFRWTADTGLQPLDGSPAGADVQILDCSADGRAAAGTIDGRGFRWTEDGGLVEIPGLVGSGPTQLGVSISADGSTVVGVAYWEQNFYLAARWSAAGGFEMLGDLAGGSHSSRAYAASGDGGIVVGEGIGGAHHAFIWEAESGAIRSIPSMLSSDYGIVVTYGLQAAVDISPDGRTIAGMGYGPDDHQQPWLARLGAKCPGDVNLDRQIDLDDLSVILANFGLFPAERQHGDLDLDRDVDLSDLAFVLSGFGLQCVP